MTQQLRQTLLVTRDGQIDTEWLEALEAEERREQLIIAGKHVLTVAAAVGKVLLNTPSMLTEHVKNS